MIQEQSFQVWYFHYKDKTVIDCLTFISAFHVLTSVQMGHARGLNIWAWMMFQRKDHHSKFMDYEMDPTSIVEDTEQTPFCPQTDRRTDGRTDGQGETSIPPFQLRWSGGYNNSNTAAGWPGVWKFLSINMNFMIEFCIRLELVPVIFN